MDNPTNNTPNTKTSSAGRPSMMPPRGPRPPMSSGPGQMAMTPKEIAGILRRHIWMIIIFVILGTMIGGGSWYLCDRHIPKYTSSRPIDVDSPVIKDPMQIGGTQPQKDIYYQFRFTKASLIKQQSMLEELLRQSAVRETQWFKKNAKVDSAGKLIGDQEKAIGKAYKDLEDNLGASAPRDNNYILVSMSCGSAKDAQTIVNEMVHVFLAQQQELARKGLAGELAQLTKQQEDIQSTLNQIENSLKSIRSGTPFARLNLGESQSFRDYMDDKLADLEKRHNELDSEKGRLESVIATLQARANAEGFDERVQEQVERDPIAQSIRSDISRLEPQLDRRLARFGEDHRLVRETQAALKQMREALGKRQFEIGEIQRHSNLLVAEETMAAQVQQLTTVQQQLQAARADYKAIDQIRNEYSQKERQRVEKRTALEEMNTLIEKKTTQHDDPKLSKLSSPYMATKPRAKSFPRKTMFIPGGFMLGMLLGVGLAFLVELMNDLLRSPSDVMRHLKVPLVGMICHSDDDKDIESVDLYHVVRQAPYSIISECYRQLRTNLKLSGTGGAAHKTLLITSGQSEDGKTTVAVNLASTLLTEERRVLLI
ncbi:MAG: GumC family protein, partial [Planctomycetota bacterium]